MTMPQPMNEFEQCISEWADRCRERDVEITSLREALAQAEQAVAQLTGDVGAKEWALANTQAQLQASQQQVTRLQSELNRAHEIIVNAFPLAEITEDDIKWAQAALAPEAGKEKG